MSMRFWCSAGVWMLAAAAASAQPVFPPAGADAFESTMNVQVTFGAQTRSIELTGPTAVLRSDPEIGDDGKRRVRTELVSMDLRGTDAMLGEVRVRLNPLMSSSGEVHAQGMTADFPADSFFDVFVRVTIPIAGDLINLEPVRVEAQNLQKLPPIFDTYLHPPPAIPLVLASNPNVTIATISGGSTHRPEQVPTFSVAPGGSLDAADLHEIGNPPVVVLSRAGLGLQSGDDVDALSYGRDAFVPGQTTVAFSVDPPSDGQPGSAVAQQAALNEAPADEFVSYLQNTNQLLVDEQALVLPVGADLDALTNQEAALVDLDGNLVPDQPVFLTLAPGSPTLASLAATAGDILVSVAGQVSIFATREDLGLLAGDAVDALCLQKAGLPFAIFRPGPGPPGPPDVAADANFDHALFSLAPGSPSLAARGFSSADLLVTDFSASRPNRAGEPPVVFATAAELGLLASDDVDALKCLAPVSFVEVDGGGGEPGCSPDEVDVAAGMDLGIVGHSGDHDEPPADLAQLWSIQNPVVGDYHGPYAYPGSPAGLFFLELDPTDPADVSWVGGPNDNCGLPHVHFPFGYDGDLFGFHQDLDALACGHGIFVPFGIPIHVIPTRRSDVPAFSEEMVDYLNTLFFGPTFAAWHRYNRLSSLPLSTCLTPNQLGTVLVFTGLSVIQANAFGFGPLGQGGAQAASLPTGPGLDRIDSPVRIGDPVAVLEVPLFTPEVDAGLGALAAGGALSALRRRSGRRARAPWRGPT
jgi:hypothetical protein